MFCLWLLCIVYYTFNLILYCSTVTQFIDHCPLGGQISWRWVVHSRYSRKPVETIPCQCERSTHTRTHTHTHTHAHTHAHTDTHTDTDTDTRTHTHTTHNTHTHTPTHTQTQHTHTHTHNTHTHTHMDRSPMYAGGIALIQHKINWFHLLKAVINWLRK